MTIASLLDPRGGAREILSSIKSGIVRIDPKVEDTSKIMKFDGGTNEDEYLNSLIGTVQSAINPEENTTPAMAIEKMKDSGAMYTLMSSVAGKVVSGDLDISKMMNSVTKMMGTLTKDNPNDIPLGNIMSMMTSTMKGQALFKQPN